MMRATRILFAMATVIRLWSFANLVPIPVAFLYDERDLPLWGVAVPAAAVAFLASFFIATMVWVPLRFLTRRAVDEDLNDREAYLTVALGWLLIALFAMMPFLLLGAFRTPVDAYFEAMSGLTTTGMSTLSQIDDAPRSLLFFRGFLQWIGGLGIIVLMVALLFRLTHGGVRLFQAESAGHSTRIRPKLRETARTLWLMYAAITLGAAATLAVLFTAHLGMGLEDASFYGLLYGMSAFSTGGFAPHGASVSAFDSAALEAVLVVLMLAGATNFSLVFLAVRRLQVRPLLRSIEWRFFIAVYGVAFAVGVLILATHGWGPLQAVREAAFNVASIYTGTGFASADYAAWPPAGLLLLLFLMFAGGMAGSTAGAIKSVRWLILFKIVTRELRRLLHPRAVIPVRLGDRIIEERTVSTVVAFFLTYMILWAAGAGLLVTLQPGLGVFDGSALAASAIGNVGGGLGVAGPFASPGVPGFEPATKAVLMTLMWLGRLELFTALLLFLPQSWRN